MRWCVPILLVASLMVTGSQAGAQSYDDELDALTFGMAIGATVGDAESAVMSMYMGFATLWLDEEGDVRGFHIDVEGGLIPTFESAYGGLNVLYEWFQGEVGALGIRSGVWGIFTEDVLGYVYAAPNLGLRAGGITFDLWAGAGFHLFGEFHGTDPEEAANYEDWYGEPYPEDELTEAPTVVPVGMMRVGVLF